MRQFRRLIIGLLLIAALTTAVYADGSTKSVTSSSIISATGSCDVTMTVTISLDTPADHLTFPLPKGVKNVTVNGSSVRTYASGNVMLADLSDLDGILGDYSLNFHYTISSLLETVDKKLVLTLPLLCGFEYPVQSLDFSITFPGEISGNPKFSSTYLQEGVETVLNVNMGGNMITGSTLSSFQDRETLTLTMQVSEDLFPGQLVIEREGNPEVVYMAICAGVALLYWILMMRCLPIVHQHSTTAPDGVTAGDIGSRLSAAGADLTMMVFSWGQMGYLKIVPDKYGRIYLEKRMNMGNERTDFEVRCFSALFRRGSRVDATGRSYALLCRKVAKTVSGAHEMYRRKAGNIMVFRVLSCGVSLFSGICMAMNMTTRSTLQTVLAVFLAILGVITAWGIQGGMYRFHIRGKTSQYIGLGCGIVWILLSLPSGQIWPAVAAVAMQMLAGVAAAYGGRRSKLGRYQASLILGLRRYLKTVSNETLAEILDDNPDYFFDMMPFAMALGVDRRFARQFGNLAVSQCTYLTVADRKRSPQEWAILMRKLADKMDARQRKMQLERWSVVSLDFLQRLTHPASKKRSSSRHNRR